MRDRNAVFLPCDVPLRIAVAVYDSSAVLHREAGIHPLG